jgi:hypothetical protein
LAILHRLAIISRTFIDGAMTRGDTINRGLWDWCAIRPWGFALQP